MFSHLHDLSDLDLNNNLCVSRRFNPAEHNQIEEDLMQCSFNYVATELLENDSNMVLKADTSPIGEGSTRSMKSEINESLQANNKELKEALENVLGKLESIETNLLHLTTNFETLHQKVENMEMKFEGLEVKFDSKLNSTFEQANQDKARIENVEKNLAAEMENLKSSMEITKEKLEETYKILDSHASHLRNVDTSLSNVLLTTSLQVLQGYGKNLIEQVGGKNP